MLAVNGYFDGKSIQLLEEVHAQKNQKVIITVLDEYIEKKSPLPKKSVFGKLSRYASPDLIEQEQKAWEKAIIR